MAGNNVQEELDVLKNDVSKLRSDVSDLVKILKDLGVEKVNTTRESLEEELRGQREKIKMRYEGAKQRGRYAADEIEEQVSEHPLGSLLTAFGIGYIIAKLSGGHS